MKESLSPVLQWLLEGDPAVRYRVGRDLLDTPEEELGELRSRIATEGWGRRLLEQRDPKTGLWGNGVYSPKWISTHYTLLELMNMGLPPDNTDYADGCRLLLKSMWANRGKVNKHRHQDVCVAAMISSMCCHARLDTPAIGEIIDYLLDRQYPDGGWNCNWERGDRHSSLHTTLAVLEAFRDYEANGYDYRLAEIRKRVPPAWEFILKKKLFRSARTGEVIDDKMLMLSFPCRWKYDILRCMEYFASVRKGYDPRMEEALSLIMKKQRKNGRWPVQHRHAGRVHFIMEETGHDSRWNTLRVLRVLRFYRPEEYKKLVGQAQVNGTLNGENR